MSKAEKVNASTVAKPAHHPVLNEGEKYGGIILGKEGEKDYRVILLPGDHDSDDHQAQLDWAESIGGDLPDDREGYLLQANLKEEFKPTWYWLKTQHATYSGDAWCQHFISGNQYWDYKSGKLRARAIRRETIE